MKAPYAPGYIADLTANLPVPIVVFGGGLTDEVAVYGMVRKPWMKVRPVSLSVATCFRPNHRLG